MSHPTINILLATFQGEAFLKAQLHSLAAQTYTRWKLHVSDDGSSDQTVQIVTEFASSCQQSVLFCSGPGKGATHNFFHLINFVSSDDPTNLYAFCDQDDVWMPDKLASAVAQHASQILGLNQPWLYCSRTSIVDEQLVTRCLSPVPRNQLGFGNALLQNIASGNTMVFNQALLHILQSINPQHSVLHDWTSYQAATGCGGIVYFDQRVTVQYRQHAANVVGSNSGLLNQMRRLRFLLRGGYKDWSRLTINAMQQISPHLTTRNLATLREFETIRSIPNPCNRLLLAVRGKFWRQSRLGQASLAVALLLGLI